MIETKHASLLIELYNFIDWSFDRTKWIFEERTIFRTVDVYISNSEGAYRKFKSFREKRSG